MTGVTVFQDALQTSCLVFMLHTIDALGEQAEQNDVPETG